MKSGDLPCILLVEDDPVALAFLTAATESAGVAVEGAGSLAQALRCAEQRDHAAWLIDANLPDGRGDALLAVLRQSRHDTPAIAHTASHLREELDLLLQVGFDEVLVKPLPAHVVADAIRRVLKQGAMRVGEPQETPFEPGKLPVWDDDVAGRAMGGNLTHVAALRDLFLDELPQVRQRIVDAGHDGRTPEVLNELHKLRASCGFVGAARLASAVMALRGNPTDPGALLHLDEAADDTLATLPSHRAGDAAPVVAG